ncbi:hypothetical protein MOQ_009328 [Trypanosoma cruzi marinkellei]|uniref:Uncharacterized protein n=1 Tax=Trypanosoma cruzi marinkellei TaxID=85056 RepID=K2ND24_TRYCR|nr:hypothetical protein MOQ_009328 [Trypanosoma cruzi marinkellei]
MHVCLYYYYYYYYYTHVFMDIVFLAAADIFFATYSFYVPLLYYYWFFVVAVLAMRTLWTREYKTRTHTKKKRGSETMDVVVSSPLLDSLYSECVPLIDIMQRHVHRSNGGHRNGGNVMNRYDGEEDIAFLSSVQAPSELCLALACVSWRREAARRSEQGPLLVFVPFHEPKDEVFVEVPVAAFGDSRRQRGLQLLSLNEYSSLFANVKDGLPPRKGFFVTFRTREAQQRFRDAMTHLIRAYSRGGPVDDRKKLLRGMGDPPNVRAHHKEGKSVEEGGENVQEEIKPSHDAVLLPRSSREASRAASIIDSLLAERDRRREEYISSIHSSPATNGQNHGDIRFGNNPSGQQQKLHRGVWSMIAETPERQLAEADPRVGEHNDTMITQSEPWHQRNADLFSNNLPSRVEQEVLLNELRRALETYDNMSAAQGSGEMSLLDASRRFLRQHQNHLRQIQQGTVRLINHPQQAVKDIQKLLCLWWPQ